MNIKLTIILSLISLIALSQTKTLYPSEAEQENIEYSDINKIEIFGNYIISKKDNKVGVYNVKSKSFVIPIKYDRINIFNKKDTIFIASFSKFEDVTKKNNQKHILKKSEKKYF
ncbi:hypothetical protein [Cellulophaga fucicola]|uniref:hypothetical protein n=1 Tax=Cellulophaga fucicola TaxID=76595 RepID=UPI003EB9D044